jgi:predicted nuclease of restriction endonuclease-like (RecB) superfamily
VRQINIIEIMTNFALGRWIVEEQQNGQDRAQYGAHVIDRLSDALTAEFGRGFARESLRNVRKFYLVFRERIPQTLFTEFALKKSQTLFGELKDNPPFSLSWSHYLILMRIVNEDERRFYEIEAANSQWDVRTLQRQYASSLYERLLLSSDKNKVMTLSTQGMVVGKPQDIVKDPLVLEFLGIPEKAEYSETELETRIIDHLQEFIMELGKGFTYVDRQKRFTFDEDHFRVDLVMYNRLLRCFVLFDLKIGKLKHQDLGQMQMYVNYYDRFEKTEEENPTVGILLCRDKNDALVELTLPEDANIYAAKYELYLPDKKLLQEKLAQWLAEEDIAE